MFGKTKCPKCKGTNSSFQLIEEVSKTKKSGNGLIGNTYNAARGLAGVATLGLSNIVLPKAKGKQKTNWIHTPYVKIAVTHGNRKTDYILEDDSNERLHQTP